MAESDQKQAKRAFLQRVAAAVGCRHGMLRTMLARQLLAEFALTELTMIICRNLCSSLVSAAYAICPAMGITRPSILCRIGLSEASMRLILSWAAFSFSFFSLTPVTRASSALREATSSLVSHSSLLTLAVRAAKSASWESITS